VVGLLAREETAALAVAENSLMGVSMAVMEQALVALDKEHLLEHLLKAVEPLMLVEVLEARGVLKHLAAMVEAETDFHCTGVVL